MLATCTCPHAPTHAEFARTSFSDRQLWWFFSYDTVNSMYGRDNTPAAVVAAMSPVRQTLFRGVVRTVAVGETVILLHPPLPLARVLIWINRGCHQHDSLTDGYPSRVRQITVARSHRHCATVAQTKAQHDYSTGPELNSFQSLPVPALSSCCCHLAHRHCPCLATRTCSASRIDIRLDYPERLCIGRAVGPSRQHVLRRVQPRLKQALTGQNVEKVTCHRNVPTKL